MDDFYDLELLCRLSGVPVCVYQGEEQVFSSDFYGEAAISLEDSFLADLKRKAKEKGFPLIQVDERGICFACIGKEGVCVILGPVIFRSISVTLRHRFYMEHGGGAAEEKPIPILSYVKFLSLVELVAGHMHGKKYTDREMIRENSDLKIHVDTVWQEQEKQLLEMEEEERSHHTYEEERKLLECIRNGQPEEVVALAMRLDTELGMMSKNELNQWKKAAVVGITLISRVAIDGGVSPAKSYRLSDYYLQKLDTCKEIPAMIACRNQALVDYAQLVHEQMEKSRFSSHVERCRDYVEKHYREKIYLEEVAERMKLSPTYLSRLFSKEMGIRLQDYVVKVRVERAGNLLKYSEKSITEIGEYVNFPSASYFGRVFKKYTGMTPKEYRRRNQPKEFKEGEV